MTHKEKATPRQENSPSKKQLHDNSIAGQRARLLDALIDVGAVGLSTIELREDYDIMHPGSRIFELREAGYRIETVWTVMGNAQGFRHRCARYVLINQAGGEL